MAYLFYDPKRDNKVMAISENSNAMEFPYIETSEYFHALDNLIIDKDKNIKFKKGTLDKEEVMMMFERRTNTDEQRMAKERVKEQIKEKLKDSKIQFKDVADLLLQIL